MHYKNGREAKVGDQVVARDYNGTAFAGVVVKTIPGTDACNLQVVPLRDHPHTYTAKECLHIDDALTVPSLPSVEPQPE